MNRRSLFAYSLCCLSLCASLEAGPEGFHLVAGDAKPPVSDGKGTTVIESGKRAIVDWKSFSIGEKETVHFAQHDHHSAILNRVVGFADSKIYGTLLSNGKVFLINKNGVVIGPHGRVETSAFVASTHDLLNEDFLKGKEMTFKGFSEAAVINLGTIEAINGDILLIGNKVSNQGTLKASTGHVGLAAGKEVFVQPEGRERIFVRIPVEASDDPDFSLEQSGTIQALSAELKSGVRPYAKAIKFSGKAEVLSTVEENGHIYLVAEEGICEFSGDIAAKEVRILGKEVYLQDEGHINVSGEHGGGTVLIGGDYKGENLEISNAERTYVGPNVKIEADALTSGNGGKVVIWSDEATTFLGTISSRGGSQAGDGGFVEVSGKQLNFNGLVDRRAPYGNAGLLYLDPLDVVIGGADTNVVNPGGAGAYTFINCLTNPAVINTAMLGTNLGMGDVTIDTSATVSGGPNLCLFPGSITVNADLTWVGAATLTMNADSFILFNTINVSGGGLSLTTIAGDVNVTDSNVAMSGAIALNINGGVNVTSSVGGGVSQLGAIGGVSGTIAGDVGVSATMGAAQIGGQLAGTGDINLTIGGGLTLTSSVGMSTAIIGYSGATVSGNITVDVTGNVSINGFIDMGLSQIGHQGNFVSGNVSVTSQTGSVSVLSNNGGRAGIGTFPRFPAIPPNNITVMAATNISLTTTVSTDTSFIAITTAPAPTGNITLVCDTAFPSSLGPGGVSVSGPGTNLIFANPGNQVSIYTVTPSQNTFPSTINNAAFSPQPVGVDSSTQQFGVFFPGGTYTSGNAYMVFYKAPVASAPTPPTPAPVVNNVTVATTAVTNILTPTNTNTTTVLLGPASESNSNDPVSDQAHHTPYNDDNRGGSQCH